MKQITEDYVSFETAQLLKEKGFDEPTKLMIDIGGTIRDIGHVESNINLHWTNKTCCCFTHQMTLKWLREVHGFIVTIDYDRYPVDNGENSIVGYGYNIQTKDNPEDYYRISESVYNSYEEAVEAALLYVLKNLI